MAGVMQEIECKPRARPCDGEDRPKMANVKI